MALPKIEPKYRPVEIDDIGTIHLRALKKSEHDKLKPLMETDPERANLEALVLTIQVDEGEDVEAWLDELPLSAIIRLMRKVSELNSGELEQALGN